MDLLIHHLSTSQPWLPERAHATPSATSLLHIASINVAAYCIASTQPCEPSILISTALTRFAASDYAFYHAASTHP